MEYKVLNNGLKMPMVGLGVYNISERETQRVVEDAKVMPVVNQYETHVLIYQGENAICIKTPMLNYGYVITDQKTTNSVNTIIMLLCSCRKMCTFAAKIAQNRFNEHEFRIYIAPFPAYLLAILSMAISEWRESAGHCRCTIRLIAEGVEEVSDGILSCELAGELR